MYKTIQCIRALRVVNSVYKVALRVMNTIQCIRALRVVIGSNIKNKK